MGFQEKSDLLSWFVDSMRTQVISHLEEKEVLQAMDEDQKLDLIQELDDLHKKCADQLFEMHQTNAKGELVQQNQYLKGLFKEIQDFKEKIDIVQIKKSQLDMIQFHNSNVDVFSRKISESKSNLNLEKLMPGGETKQDTTDKLIESFKNIDVMDPGDADDLVDKLNERNYQYDFDTRDNVKKIEEDYYERAYTSARHGLNYSKLYHGLDGGYSMEKLKKVLQRIKSDVKDNIHPFIDPEQD